MLVPMPTIFFGLTKIFHFPRKKSRDTDNRLPDRNWRVHVNFIIIVFFNRPYDGEDARNCRYGLLILLMVLVEANFLGNVRLAATAIPVVL
jgi:hypothetical protein